MDQFILQVQLREIQSQINKGYRDAFISKFDPDGTKKWTRLIGTSDTDDGHVINTGIDGSIYVAGEAGKGGLVDTYQQV